MERQGARVEELAQVRVVGPVPPLGSTLRDERGGLYLVVLHAQDIAGIVAVPPDEKPETYGRSWFSSDNIWLLEPKGTA